MTDLSPKRVKELLRAEAKLEALEAGGVDNWEWYGDALADWRKDNRVEELLEDTITEVQELICEYGVAEYPSVQEAGMSIYLNTDGEEALKSLLSGLLHKVKEEDDD